MNKKNRIIFFLFLIVTFCGCHRRSNTVQKLPEILFDHQVADFGKIPLDFHVLHTFWYHNSGKSSLKIYNIESTCSCTTIKWSDKLIESGKTGGIYVTYSPKFYGHFKEAIMVHSNAKDSVVILTIKGMIVE